MMMTIWVVLLTIAEEPKSTVGGDQAYFCLPKVYLVVGQSVNEVLPVRTVEWKMVY